MKDGNARQLKKTANALAPIEPEKEKPRTPDDSDSISDEAKEEHTTDATRFHEEMWETNLNLKWFSKKKILSNPRDSISRNHQNLCNTMSKALLCTINKFPKKKQQHNQSYKNIK